MRSRAARRRRTQSRTPTGAHFSAHEIILEIEPCSRVVRSRVRTGSSLIGSMRVAMPSRRRKSGMIADRLSPARSRRVRSTCVARSPSPRRNQVSPPSVAKRRHERPGLVAPAPAGLGIVEPRERVEQRVEIGRDRQAEMLEIVAGVGDHGQAVGRQHAVQAERELGAADAARQRQHAALGLIGTDPPARAGSARAPALAGAARKPAHQHRGSAFVALTHHQRGGRGDLVGEAGLGDAAASRPYRSGWPRKSSNDGRPAAPSATPTVPRRHGRPKLSLMMTRDRREARRQRVAQRSGRGVGIVRQQQHRLGPAAGATFERSTPALAMT